MAFPQGSRVRLTSSHAGIPAGSLGTVQNGTDVTTLVLFDVDPTRFVLCPNSILQPTGAAKQHALSFSAATTVAAPVDSASLFWHTPRFRPPHVGTSSNFIATTATANTLSLLFEGAQVSLRGHTRSGMWLGSAEFSLTGTVGKLSGQIRGSVEQTKGTISDVILCVGGSTTRIVFGVAASQDFTEEFSVDMPEEASIQTITAVLICERQPSAGDCLLAIDSVDLRRA